MDQLKEIQHHLQTVFGCQAALCIEAAFRNVVCSLQDMEVLWSDLNRHIQIVTEAHRCNYELRKEALHQQCHINDLHAVSRELETTVYNLQGQLAATCIEAAFRSFTLPDFKAIADYARLVANLCQQRDTADTVARALDVTRKDLQRVTRERDEARKDARELRTQYGAKLLKENDGDQNPNLYTINSHLDAG